MQKLADKLGLSKNSIASLVNYLSTNGLLEVRTESSVSYGRTRLGSRVLASFIELHRIYGNEIAKSTASFRTCFTCESHPSYPGLLPVTLHLDGKCLICGNS
ncbi:MAG: hypothetical protein ACYC7D_07230 [Nitrososphaerales archaeon]